MKHKYYNSILNRRIIYRAILFVNITMFTNISKSNEYNFNNFEAKDFSTNYPQISISEASGYTIINFGTDRRGSDGTSWEYRNSTLVINGNSTGFNSAILGGVRRGQSQQNVYARKDHYNLIFNGNITIFNNPTMDNTYIGTIGIAPNGTLTLGEDNAVPTGSDLILYGNSLFNLNGNDQVINSLFSGQVTYDSKVDVGDNKLTISGVSRESINNIFYGEFYSSDNGVIEYLDGTHNIMANQSNNFGHVILKGDSSLNLLFLDNDQNPEVANGRYRLESKDNKITFRYREDIGTNVDVQTEIIGNGTVSFLNTSANAIFSLNENTNLNTLSRIEINGSNLILNNEDQLSPQGHLHITNAQNSKLSLNGFNQTVGSIGSASNRVTTNTPTIDLGGAILTIEGNPSNTTGIEYYIYNIEGNGTIIKNDKTSLYFAGDLTHDNTIINNGSIYLGSLANSTSTNAAWLDGTTGSITGDIENNATFIFNRTNEYSYGGKFSGNGDIFVKHGGVITLTNDNTYFTGTTYVEDGELIIGDGDSNGTLGGDIVNTSLLTFNRSNDYTFDGEISGSGDIFIRSGGVITLSNDSNDYSGTTFIDDGELILGNGNEAGSLGGNIVNMGRLVFNRADDYIYNNNITGTGEIEKINDGKLIFTNNVSASLLSISSGVVQIGNGGTIGSLEGNIVITEDAELAINRSDDFYFDNVVTSSGNGLINKLGTNKLMIDTDTISVGNFIVSQGSLIVGSTADTFGKISSSVNVLNSGLLGGHGLIVGNVSLSEGATLSPGNSIGTLTIDGDVIFDPESIFFTEIDPIGKNDLLSVSGNVNLNDSFLYVKSNTGPWNTTTEYKIIEANSVVGTFGTIDSDLVFLDPIVLVNPDNVILKLVRNEVPLIDYAETENQKEVAQSIDKSKNSDVYKVILTLTGSKISSTFEQLSGELHANIRSVLFDESRHIREETNNRLFLSQTCSHNNMNEMCRDRESVNLWIRYTGSEETYKSTSNNHKTKGKSSGLIIGADKSVSENLRAGFAVSRNKSDINVNTINTKADVDSTTLGFYVGGRIDTVNLRAGSTYTWNDIDGKREIDYGSFNERIKSSYDADTLQAFVEVGYPIKKSEVTYEPFIGFSYIEIEEDTVRETGGISALRSHDGKKSLEYSSVGFRISSPFTKLNDMPLNVNASVVWQHALGNENTSNKMSFDGVNKFTVKGVGVNQDTAVVQTGLDLKVNDNMNVNLNYSGVLGSDFKDHAIRAGINIAF